LENCVLDDRSTFLPDLPTALLRQHHVLARFGELALNSTSLDEILTEACHLVGEALGTDLAKVVELQKDGQALLVRAGVGWKPGVVGQMRLKLNGASSEGHALRNGEPVISTDIANETRFDYAWFLKDNGVQAFINVPIIGGKDKPPFGILQVDSRTPREFTEEDILFLRSYANLLAASVSRIQALEVLQTSNVELAKLVEEYRRVTERQIFLSKEMDHRAKNILAVVQAVVRLTKADDVPDFVDAIEGRIAALARAQALLSVDRWSGADLHTLLRGELAQFFKPMQGGPSVELDGLALLLPPGVAQPFSLALHEMATNAVKYGALSDSCGRLKISWRVERATNDILMFRWAESGGPPVYGPPDKRGFGSRVLTDTLRTQLGGTISMLWNSTGLICDFTVPLSRASASPKSLVQ
jgi:two-component sensor histidine kinase